MKYKNLIDVPLFGEYEDPFQDRKVIGNTRPDFPLDSVTPLFKRKFDKQHLYFSWLAHSSIFLNISGLSILIDPIFSKYASPVPVSRLRRFEQEVVSSKDFNYIDFVLITHNHYDHLDRKTIISIDSKVKRYIVPKGVKFNLLLFGIQKEKIIELEWNESFHFFDLEIVCLPSQHDSSRFMIDMNRSLWCSYLIKNKQYTVFDSGDGGFSNYFDSIYQKYGTIDLAIMECGQYNVRWHAIHMFPEESVEACRMLHAKLAIPVHYGAFVLSNHAWNEPVIRFERRAKELEVPYRIVKINEIIQI